MESIYYYLRAFSTIVIACLLATTIQVFFFSPISPDPLQLPAEPTSPLPTNTLLQGVTKLGEGYLDKPEGVCVDREEGVLYTATRDGWIKRLHINENRWEDWRMIGGDALLGLTTTSKGHIIVCDAEKGLVKVGEDGESVLVSHLNGVKISFADDVIEAWDGSLYFSVASTKFGFHDWHLDLLEAKPHGQLLKYDPSSNHTSILLDHLHFANGVTLSKDQDYLVVCETWKFRCLKYWLKGEKRGKTEIFIENLPGGPDNINLAPDGSFWIALIQLTHRSFEFIHGSKASKKLLATFPKLYEQVSGVRRKAMVVNVDGNGKIMKKLDDPTGEVMSFVTSAIEFEDYLYLGSLNNNFLGKLSLKNIH